MLEAAHIVPVAEQGSDDPSNGILLRADLHRLFDNGLMAINPDTGHVRYASKVHKDDREEAATAIPNPSRFKERWNSFEERE